MDRVEGMERICPSCGADPGTGAFCQNCGTQLAGDGAAGPSEASPPAAPPSPPAQQPPAQQPPAQQPPAQQPAPQRRGFRTGCLVVAVIFLGVLAAGAYFGWRFIDDEILPGIDEATDAFTPLSESPPGPCFDVSTSGGVLTDWTEVSCDGPRQIEVTFAASFEDGSFPGDQYLVDTAEDTCLNAFETYVGISPDQSRYDYDFLLPTEEMWDEGRRNGICLVVADDGSPLTGLVKGSET